MQDITIRIRVKFIRFFSHIKQVAGIARKQSRYCGNCRLSSLLYDDIFHEKQNGFEA